jgi:nucleoside-diphosphate-sugar epimerase
MEMTDLSYDSVCKRLADKRVLLVGGAGFIGHNLSIGLRAAGVETMVMDNLMINSIVDSVFGRHDDQLQNRVYQSFLLERFGLMRDAGVTLKNGDGRNSTDVMRQFGEFQPTHVVHLAAIASAVEAKKDPGLCFDLQLVTLRNVLEACRMGIAPVETTLLLSSSTVYGDFETPEVDENTRPRPRGIYANTKYMAERLARTYNYQHGLGTSIIRPSALYGERCVSRRVSQVFIENAMRGLPLLLEGGGDGMLDFTYIDDLIQGIIRALALHPGKGYSQTFNITRGHARTIADLASIVRQVVPDLTVEDRPRANDKPIRGTLSVERAKEQLGFEPEWSLEDGYLQYCRWYQDRWAAQTNPPGEGS